MAHGWPTGLRSRTAGKWAATKRRHQWLRHVVSAWDRLQRNNGNLYAGAITYFSFLAIFPLLLLGVAVTGFVLHSDPALQQSLFRHLSNEIPGEFGSTVRSAVHSAIDNRSGVGVVGLLGVLLTGLGWINNLRAAIDAVWGCPPVKRNFFKARLANLLVLAGLGIGIVVSLGLTVAGTALTDEVLDGLGLSQLPGATIVLGVLGIALAVIGDTVIFWWLLIRLPVVEVPERIAWRGALLAAVGFEVLKIVGTVTIALTADSPTAGPFAGIIAVLVWIQLVARFMLFACAWTATLAAERPPVDESPSVAGEPALGVSDDPVVSSAAVGMVLVGVGVVTGAAATWVVTRPPVRVGGRGAIRRHR
jgi:membrane protein